MGSRPLCAIQRLLAAWRASAPTSLVASSGRVLDVAGTGLGRVLLWMSRAGISGIRGMTVYLTSSFYSGATGAMRDCREFRVWSVMMGKKDVPHGQAKRTPDP